MRRFLIIGAAVALSQIIRDHSGLTGHSFALFSIFIVGYWASNNALDLQAEREGK